MLNRLTHDAAHIYLALGATDFRRQTTGLVAMVQQQFNQDPYKDSCVFIFCNRRKNAVKVLRYDRNGFILAHKKLLEKMKFQWPKDEASVKQITAKQLEWLLSGLSIEEKKAHREVKIHTENSCF